LLRWFGNKSNSCFCRKRTIEWIFFEKEKMRKIRKIWFYSLLAVAALLVQDTSATYYLPDNSYKDGAWQAGQVYKGSGLDVLVDFAVYDTDGLQFAHETAFADQFDIAEQYIYTYQIFNQPDEIYEVITYFSILDIDGEQIYEALLKADTGYYDDCSGTAKPTSKDSNSQKGRGRTFDGGRMFRGGHSLFLVCR